MCCLPALLPQAWLNEKFAPELLDSKCEIVDCMMEQLDHMVKVAWAAVTGKREPQPRGQQRCWLWFSPSASSWLKLDWLSVLTKQKTSCKHLEASRKLPPLAPSRLCLDELVEQSESGFLFLTLLPYTTAPKS